MNILAIAVLVWPALAYGWISGKLLSLGPLRRARWLPLVGVPMVVGMVYYLIFWRGWEWLHLYPIVLLGAVVLVVGFIGYPAIFLYMAISQRDESVAWRLKQLGLAVGIGLAAFVVLRAVVGNGLWRHLIPWTVG